MKIIKINAIWCSGCLAMKKTWKEIEKEYPEIEFITYDYDIDEKQIKNLNVGDILPVTILQNNDHEIRLIGEKTKKEIIEAIENLNA